MGIVSLSLPKFWRGKGEIESEDLWNTDIKGEDLPSILSQKQVPNAYT